MMSSTTDYLVCSLTIAALASWVALAGAADEHAARLRRVVFLAALTSSLCVLALFAPTPARAATLSVHTVSWHDQPHENGTPYESRTPGVSLRLASGATFGVLRNSLRHTSVYAGYTWSGDEARPLSLAFTAALITGYPAAPVVPLLAPSVRVGLGLGQGEQGAALRLLLIPKWHPKQGASVVSAAFEWSLP